MLNPPSARPLFLYQAPAPTELSTLSLHDALPISRGPARVRPSGERRAARLALRMARRSRSSPAGSGRRSEFRSEEHTSELQSHHDLVCRLLLEKKNNEDGVAADERNRRRCRTANA